MAEIRRRCVTDQCNNPSFKPIHSTNRGRFAATHQSESAREAWPRLFRRMHRSILADQRGQGCIRCNLGLLAMDKQG